MQSSSALTINETSGSAWKAGSSREEGSEGVDYDKLLGYEMPTFTYSYTERDLALYALGVGAGVADPLKDLNFTYELHPDFAALPTFGVIPPFRAIVDIVAIPHLRFNPMKLLHGESYLEIKRQPEPKDTLTNYAKISAVYDKKSAASVIVDVRTVNQKGEEVYFNQMTMFIRGIGGFGGPSGPKVQPIKVPDRAPDAVELEKTLPGQALLYRLSGDLNPLHVDPEMAAIGGFKRPILHGLCTFGYAGRAVLKHFCQNDPAKFKSIKVRFSRSVYPGETLRTEMWLTAPDTVVFVTKVVERNEEVLSQCVAKIEPFTPAAKSQL